MQKLRTLTIIVRERNTFVEAGAGAGAGADEACATSTQSLHRRTAEAFLT